MSTTGHQLPFGQRIGIFILAEISAVSASSILTLLAYIAYSTVVIRKGATRKWRLETPVHLFLLNQLICDLIQALGGLMNLKWMIDGVVHRGAFCTAQGLIKQLADVGTALSAGNVAIYTFSALIFRMRPNTILSMSRAVFIVAGIWFAIILNVAINVGINGASRFYGPTGPWCWITSEFSVQRTVADFLWMWISAFSSILAYIAVFLVLGGFVVVEGWRVRWTGRREFPTIPRPRYHLLAYKMLAYPIIYIITVLPLAAARYNDFARGNTPFAVVVVADGFYLASGFLNVLLYRYTRPYLLPRRGDGLEGRLVSPRFESVNSRNHLPHSVFVGSSHHTFGVDTSLSEPKSPEPVYEMPDVSRHYGTRPITASPGRNHGHERELSGVTVSGEDVTKMYDEMA